MRDCIKCPLLVLIVLSSHQVCGAGERTQRDVAYSNTGANRTKLDVFAPGTGEHLPVLVWIHGGGWRIGDKSNVQRKPAAFNQAGYVFVSINYRLHPTANFADQAGDVARAISWVKNHAPDFGGDPGRIFVMGHSAGAHLAALVGTDARYLESVGLKLSDLSGVILLDGAGYDIPRQVREAALPRIKELYTTVFSEDEAKQREASPITHVARGRNIPPFLILHVATRRDARAQSEALAARLRGAGVEARVIPAEGKTHMTINRELGMPGDRPTREVLQFLQEHATRKPAP